MHSFHFCIIVLYTCCIPLLHCSAIDVAYPIQRPLIYYTLRLRRRGLCMTLPLLWEHCIAAYLKDVFVSHSNSAHTVRDYAGTLRRFFERSARTPEQYTREDVIDFLAMPTPRGTPPSHVKTTVRFIMVRGFYRFASRYTVYDAYTQPYKLFAGENPAEGLHGMKIEVRPRYLTEDEVRRFFGAIDRSTVIGKRDFALFLAYLSTARRLSEIANLTWGAIEYGIVTDGKGSRRGYLYHFSGKGKGGQDDVAELLEPVYQAIVDYLEVSGRMATIEPDSFIFMPLLSPNGGGLPIDPYKPLSGGTILRIAKEYAEKARIDRVAVNVHIFRHTSAKHRIDLGQDISDINKF